MATFTRDDILNRVIPHRLEAVAVLQIVTRLLLSWDASRPMKVFFDDKLTIEGNSNAFTHPVLEAGLVHCRALLEFVGLKVSPADPEKLVNRRGKRTDDFGVEDFSGPCGPLSLVTPEQAVAHYSGNSGEAEKALALVLFGTNKLIAHVTEGFPLPDDSLRMIEIATRGVPAIVVSHLFTPLGLPAPVPNISSRRRNDC
jgi:hypothetical protein